MNNLGRLMLFGVEGTKMTKELELYIKETGLGGIILFKRNIESPKQVRRFVEDLRAASDRPLIIGVDQEGGRVARFSEPFTTIPSMHRIGRAAEKDESIAFDVGRVLGRELSAVGINCDFAPVLDVATNAANPVIGDRSFSPDPEAVARLGAELIRGLQESGVAACGKHFPGHGDTDVDSHKGLPTLSHTRARFDACELIPFRAAIAAGVASIMTAHLMIPNLDREAPATISRPITSGILRSELRFDGLVFTDCLTMQGIASIYPTGESAWRAISAGADVAVVCHDPAKQRAALDGLRRALDDGKLDSARVDEAQRRGAAFRERFCGAAANQPSLGVIGCRDHQRVISRIG